jgi:hypothetical protein
MKPTRKQGVKGFLSRLPIASSVLHENPLYIFCEFWSDKLFGRVYKYARARGRLIIRTALVSVPFDMMHGFARA